MTSNELPIGITSVEEYLEALKETIRGLYKIEDCFAFEEPLRLEAEAIREAFQQRKEAIELMQQAHKENKLHEDVKLGD